MDKIPKLGLRNRLNLDDHWPAGWSPRPGLVCVTPTYRCNLNCQMCYQRDDRGRPRQVGDGELTPEGWKGVIDRVADFAPTIYWIGGEVLIYPRMVELFAYARSRGLQVSFSTNGFSLAAIADQVVEMGIENVVVSLDGNEEVHNAIRRNAKSFAWAVKGVQAMLQARQARAKQRPTVTVGLTITRQNHRHIADFYAFARDLGVDVVQYIGLIYMSPATVKRHSEVMQAEFGLVPQGMHILCDKSASKLDAAVLQREMDDLRARAPASPRLEFWSAGTENHLEAHYGPDENLPLAHQRCGSIWRNLIIQPNGDVTACPFLLEVVVGNVLEQDLHTIWNNSMFRRFRKRIKSGLLPGCTRCTWAVHR